MHAQYGNGHSKSKTHIKLRQLNNGHGNLTTSKHLVVNHLEKENPDVMTHGGANLSHNKPNFDKDFLFV